MSARLLAWHQGNPDPDKLKPGTWVGSADYPWPKSGDL